MKLVNPMGRQANTLETGANYAADIRCNCYGGEEVRTQTYYSSTPCVCACTGSEKVSQSNFSPTFLTY